MGAPRYVDWPGPGDVYEKTIEAMASMLYMYVYIYIYSDIYVYINNYIYTYIVYIYIYLCIVYSMCNIALSRDK